MTRIRMWKTTLIKTIAVSYESILSPKSCKQNFGARCRNFTGTKYFPWDIDETVIRRGGFKEVPMKLLTLSVFAFSLVLPSAYAAEAGSRGFFNCARKVIDRKVDGITGFETLRSLFERVAQSHDFTVAKRDCKDLLKNKEPDRTISHGEYIDQANRVIYTINNDSVADVLSRFVNPTIRCSTFGAGASLGVIGAAGAGLEIGSCRSTDGRRFRIVSAIGEIGAGAGVSVHLTGRQFIIEPNQMIDVESSEGITYGGGLSFGLYTNGSDIDGFNAGVG